MLTHPFFYLGMSFLLMHEMDAIRCKEWRIFPGLSLLDDSWGYRVFTLAHAPLCAWALMELSREDPSRFIRGFDVFFLVHLGLHLVFLGHPRNEFKDGISWTLITGAALCGIADILMT